MNVEHINPFVQGSQGVIAQLCGETANIGKMFVKAPYNPGAASVAVSVSGEVTGAVIYSMQKQVACNIASKMMGGMPVAALDDMSSSALSELINMISGSAATAFSGKGMKIGVAAPVFRADAKAADFAFVKPDSKVLCIPLTFADGSAFEIDIFFA